ncbi:MAG: hypothetical protein H7329_06760 [Opitutaceae bacterium]|nr:hypothetical protein [Cytophagales bacterium]
MALALLLNGALLAVLLPWLRRQWRAAGMAGRVALLVGLGGRLLVGGVRGWRPVHDAGYMSHYGHLLTAQAWVHPADAWRTLWGNELHFAGQSLVFHGMSNTFFLVKVLAFLNLASLDENWLNALYLAVFSFVGCWCLAQSLRRAFPHTPSAAVIVAFVAWPSVVLWATGISKEAVLLGSGAGLLAIFIEFFYWVPTLGTTRNVRWWLVMSGVLLALLHFNIRYFFALPLLGVLVGLGFVRLLQQMGLAQRRWAQLWAFGAVLSAGVWLGTALGPAFGLNKLTNQVVRVYDHHVGTSADKPHFAYPDLQPTGKSLLRHAPLAAANALTRPWLGESRQLLYLAAGFENLVLLALSSLAIWAIWRGRAGKLPFGLVLALGVHCLALAVLLGLTTPNLGSLHRYRTGLLPYLLLLLLQNDYAAAGLRRLGLGDASGGTPHP